MQFDPAAYGSAVAELLALDNGGQRLMPLTSGACSSAEAASRLRGSTLPPAVRAGLWVYFSAFDEAHSIAQDLPTAEGSYWHAILHRQEPDASNSRFWFNQVGRHVIFDALAAAAREIASFYPEAGWKPPVAWDPSVFVRCCDAARRAPGSPLERMALEIQRAEWWLLFDHCARPAHL